MNRKVKIIATLGPSINTLEILEQMILKGTNTFRINCSHTKENEITSLMKLVRKASDNVGISVAVLADLQGPKVRINIVEDNTFVNKGDIFYLTSDNSIGNKYGASVSYKEIVTDTKPHERILLDDGKIILEVLENTPDKLKTKVIQGGLIKSNKGLNLPNTKLSISPITEKDIKNLKEAIKNDVDWVALSFVRNGKDIDDLNKLMSELSSYKIPVIAKIERPEALENIDDIIEKCDAIMIARGDLGLETAYDMLPLVQKKLIKKSVDEGKPIIVATQMLESMIEGLTPSRSDVSDIANAVIDGADTLMLSGETSIGKNPLAVIEKMSNIIIETEKYLSKNLENKKIHKSKFNERYITNIICAHAAYISIQDKHVKTINTITQTGYSAKILASMRPACNIIAFCYDERTYRNLNLVWGINPFLIKPQSKVIEHTLSFITNLLKNKKIISSGDRIINLIAVNDENDLLSIDALRIKQIN